MTKRNEGFAFHVHHDILAEYCTDYVGRVAYIKSDKPPHERKLRLRLFKLIPISKLPWALAGVVEARDDAWKAYVDARDDAWKACDDALKASDDALKAAMPDFIKLHAELCPDCPWNGKTIFPVKEG